MVVGAGGKDLEEGAIRYPLALAASASDLFSAAWGQTRRVLRERGGGAWKFGSNRAERILSGSYRHDKKLVAACGAGEYFWRYVVEVDALRHAACLSNK
jgi:hypothetical protein